MTLRQVATCGARQDARSVEIRAGSPIVGGMVSGEVVRLLCKAMREESAVADVDVAIVLNDGPARAAAQHERSDEDWSELPPKMRDAADALAKKARNGDLVLFLGAGVSQGAGLPFAMWRDEKDFDPAKLNNL